MRNSKYLATCLHNWGLNVDTAGGSDNGGSHTAFVLEYESLTRRHLPVQSTGLQSVKRSGKIQVSPRNTF
jgi:hypothetical protein